MRSPPLASTRAVRMPGTTTAYIFGGYTGDVLGAFQQIGEVVMLLVASAR